MQTMILTSFDAKLHNARSDLRSLMLSYTMQAMIYEDNDLDIFWC
jgi:hypothetical protein